METDGEAVLVLAADWLSGSNEAAAAGDEDALPVGRVEGDGDERQDRGREVPGELVDEDGFHERAFVDSFPAGRLRRQGEPRRVVVAGELPGVGERDIEFRRRRGVAGAIACRSRLVERIEQRVRRSGGAGYERVKRRIGRLWPVRERGRGHVRSGFARAAWWRVVPVGVRQGLRPEGARRRSTSSSRSFWRSSASAGERSSPESGSITGSGGGASGSARGPRIASRMRWRVASRSPARRWEASRRCCCSISVWSRRVMPASLTGCWAGSVPGSGAGVLGVVAGEDGAEDQGRDQDAEQDGGSLGGQVCGQGARGPGGDGLPVRHGDSLSLARACGCSVRRAW